MEKKIVKIICDNTEFWQPYGGKNSCFIIEEKEPIWWRINPKWAKEVAKKIVKLYVAQRWEKDESKKKPQRS